MKLLLDTNAFLWWAGDDRRLSAGAREFLRDSSSTIYLSVVSAWEIAIKAKLEKLELATEPGKFVDTMIERYALRVLPIEARHAVHTYTLPLLHNDPFDRLLVAQSQVEDLALLTNDPSIRKYDLQVLW